MATAPDGFPILPKPDHIIEITLCETRLHAQVFGNSPDETSFFRLSLNRFPVADAMVAIQPSLVAFSLSDAPQPVLLDVASITVRHCIPCCALEQSPAIVARFWNRMAGKKNAKKKVFFW